MSHRHFIVLSLAASLLAVGSQSLAADQAEQKEQKRVPTMLTGKKTDASKSQTGQAASKHAAQTGKTESDKKRCVDKRGRKVDC